MRRTQIQLDEATYELLRQKAHERHVSLARVVREAVAQYLSGAPKRRLTLADFKFIGIGSAKPGGPTEWGDIAYEEHREKADELRRMKRPSHTK